MFGLLFSSLVIVIMVIVMISFIQVESFLSKETKQSITGQETSNSEIALMSFLRYTTPYDLDGDGNKEMVSIATLIASEKSDVKFIEGIGKEFFDPIYGDDWQLIVNYNDKKQLFGNVLFSNFKTVNQVLPNNNGVITLEFSYRT